MCMSTALTQLEIIQTYIIIFIAFVLLAIAEKMEMPRLITVSIGIMVFLMLALASSLLSK